MFCRFSIVADLGISSYRPGRFDTCSVIKEQMSDALILFVMEKYTPLAVKICLLLWKFFSKIFNFFPKFSIFFQNFQFFSKIFNFFFQNFQKNSKFSKIFKFFKISKIGG